MKSIYSTNLNRFCYAHLVKTATSKDVFYNDEYVIDSLVGVLENDSVADSDTRMYIGLAVEQAKRLNDIADHIKSGYESGNVANDCEDLYYIDIALCQAERACDNVSEFNYYECHLYLAICALAAFTLSHAFLGFHLLNPFVLNDSRMVEHLTEQCAHLSSSYSLEPDDAGAYFDYIRDVM